MSTARKRLLLRSSMIAVCVGLLAGTGWLWVRDRSSRWEEPRWRPNDFVRVREAVPFAGASEVRLVAVQPACSHCRTHVALALARRGNAPNIRIGALVVDMPQPPRPTLLGDTSLDGVWWDAAGRWRRRWGHRIYGEVLVFDKTGRHLTTLPPGAGVDSLGGIGFTTSP